MHSLLPLAALLLVMTLTAPPTPAAAAGAEHAPQEETATYYTLGVMEPDRVASAWLIERHVAPGARVLLLPEGDEPPADGEPFDLPGARWSRRASRSTFEIILDDQGIDDPALVAMGELIRAGELAFWMLEPGSPEERFDRTLKEHALEDDVEAAYAYLDRVYAAGGEVPGGD